MHSVGLDFGSVYTKAVLVDGRGQVVRSLYRKKAADDLDALERFLEEIRGERFRCGIVGLRSRRLVSSNALMAIAAGVARLHEGVRSVIEIGGHTAKFLVLRADGPGVRDFTTNEACAAGTGSFLEQQARRLELTIEELAAASLEAKSGATVAGRCSVFAKSDMIHLQQKGTPVAEIAYGLCLAICRNAQATLLKGRAPELPLVVAGGCASNGGVLRAFREVLRAEIAVSSHPGLEGAIGAALNAADVDPLDVDAIASELRLLLSERRPHSQTVAPLRRPAHATRPAEPMEMHVDPAAAYLGIDVGSVSTDLVLTDERGTLLSSIYLPTRGRPVDVLLEGLSTLRSRFPAGLEILGCGSTGSGRHLAARLVGADAVKNEITCQMLGARHFVPDVDTILEIGGQDSKFISLRNGAIADFAMNKICAAGTGSFLEEQARELGIDILRDFASSALTSARPVDVGTRCTVFMETEVVNAMRDGVPVDAICAGLAHSIVRNYLDKVVGARRLGETIVFQGGVASNDAVVAAFEIALGKPVFVHPYNRLSGAIGAALAAIDARAVILSRRSRGAAKDDEGSPAEARDPLPTQGILRRALPAQDDTLTRFKGFDAVRHPSLRSFECRHCENRCEVNVVTIDKERAFFGDTCERYTSRTQTAARPALSKAEGPVPPNLAVEYIEACEAEFENIADGRLTIGVPRASASLASLPFWAAFFGSLGHRPVLSPASSEETLALGLKHLAVGVCLPIKLAAGHVHALASRGVDLVFAPSIVNLPGGEADQAWSCPYAMAVPFMVGANRDARFLAPMLSTHDEEAFLDGWEPHLEKLGNTREEVRDAFHAALLAEDEVRVRFVRRARELLDGGDYRYAFAILGKPYNTLDAYMNLSLVERLRRLGVLAIPQKFLPIETDGLRSELPWRFSGEIEIAADAIARVEGIHPVIVSNFGCGPDAFTLKRVDDLLGAKPHLLLEFDEHRGEAGVVTRIEAFLDQLDSAARAPLEIASVPGVLAASRIPGPGDVVRIPYFADHAHAFCGLLRHRGCDAAVLPLPTARIRQLGERHSLGKECHAYSMLAGDLLELSRVVRALGAEGRTQEDEAGSPAPSHEQPVTFYFPGTSLPCLLHEYGRGMRTLLRELGITNVTVSAPTGAEIFAALDMDTLERFYLGLLSIELLVKAVCQIRPYELEKGTTDAVHAENLQRIEDAIASGNVLQALDEALGCLSGVAVQSSATRPVVGMAGDVFTKSNAAANDDLVRWLEDEGIEVWPSPFQIDLLDFGISRNLSESIARLDLPGLLLHGALAADRAWQQWRVRRVVGGRITREDEPGYQEMKRFTAPYMSNESHTLLFMNVAKVVDFARNGADGIINAICFNCMMGNASAAINEKIRRDYDDIPIITAVYSGGEDPSRRMVLEAFVSQVKAHHARRVSRVRPSRFLPEWAAIASRLWE
jgi:predicted CoA-substrate-specific enzyme activase